MRIRKGHPKHSSLNKMKRQRNTKQVKELDKCPPNQTKEEEVGSLPEKEFRMRMVEINEAERKKEKQNKRNEDNLRDLWNNVKYPNIRIMGVPEEQNKKKGHEKILEEIIVETFPKMGKGIVTQVQETQRAPNRINPR